MEEWRRQIHESLTTVEDLITELGYEGDVETLHDIVKQYPMRITPYMVKLIKEKGEAIARQVIPSPEENRSSAVCVDDPLNEEGDSPVPHVVHRYPDRVLFMVTNQCPIYCRFCTRKRLVGQPGFLEKGAIDRGILYIRDHPEVRDVILSGGDPLLLPDDRLEYILKSLREIPHVEIIRIGSRVPGSLPQRITPELCDMIKKYHPLYMNLHFNHPDEITPEVKEACGRLSDAGVPLGSQTVLLKGINDDPQVMKSLMHKLLAIRVKPYYLYQADIVRGTDHFRTSVEKGLEIIRALQGWTSGMAVPHYVIDAPGGGGKVVLSPFDSVLGFTEKEVIVRNYDGGIYRYPQVEHEDNRDENGSAVTTGLRMSCEGGFRDD